MECASSNLRTLPLLSQYASRESRLTRGKIPATQSSGSKTCNIPASVGGMLGNIGRRAAVLAAEREPLDKTQSDERGGSSDPDRGVVRKDSNQERRQAHHDDGDEKRVFAS